MFFDVQSIMNFLIGNTGYSINELHFVWKQIQIENTNKIMSLYRRQIIEISENIEYWMHRRLPSCCRQIGDVMYTENVPHVERSNSIYASSSSVEWTMNIVWWGDTEWGSRINVPNSLEKRNKFKSVRRIRSWWVMQYVVYLTHNYILLLFIVQFQPEYGISNPMFTTILWLA